jgi:hypothetical protein
VDREAQLPAAGDFADDPAHQEPVDRQPTPEEAALLCEMVEGHLRGLDEKERQIVRMGLLGFDDLEISARVGRTEYRVRRARRGFARQVQGLLDREPDPPAA